MGKVIAIFNQKGGVGKTTTNINLSASLVKLGKKVLVIDNDPQGNTSSGLGIDKRTLERELYDIIIEGDKAEEIITSTNMENLDIIPTNVNLAGAEVELIEFEDREFRLLNALENVKDKYDYIFIDCPPSLGLLSINAMVAADSILIPIQCEYYALEGVSQLMKTYELIRTSLNNSLEIQGIVLSMFDGRTNLSIQVVDEVKNYFGGKVYTTLIPRNVRLAEAPSHGIPVIEYAAKSKGAEAYMDLAREFLDMEVE